MSSVSLLSLFGSISLPSVSLEAQKSPQIRDKKQQAIVFYDMKVFFIIYFLAFSFGLH